MAPAVGIVGSARVVQRKRLALHHISLDTLVAVLILDCFRMNARRADSLRTSASLQVG